MAKDTKPTRTAPKSDFDQFVANALDRVVVEQVEGAQIGQQVRLAEEQRIANTDMNGRPLPPQPEPVTVRPPNPLLEKAMERRFLPIAGLTGNEVPQPNVREDADPRLVEAHKLIGDLLAGRMINVSSPLIWGRIKATQEKLRVAISVEPATTKES